jgi:phytoene desaturase
MFIAYLGIGRELKGLEHHNLYFAKDWNEHFDDIFKNPAWPQEDPCFYLSCITKTDQSSAPQGCENVFLLVPVAPGLADTDEQREAYFSLMVEHVKRVTGEDLSQDVLVKRLYTHRDFIQDYHAYKGTALGLSHTLLQTAVFRPRHQAKRLSNLYYTGQYTHPGVGVPMVLIASELIAKEIQETYGR